MLGRAVEQGRGRQPSGYIETYVGFYVSYRYVEGIDVEDVEQWRPSSIPGHASALDLLHISLYP